MSTGGKVMAGGGLLGVVILVLNMLLSGGGGENGNIQLPTMPEQQSTARQLSPEEEAADTTVLHFRKWCSQIPKMSGGKYLRPVASNITHLLLCFSVTWGGKRMWKCQCCLGAFLLPGRPETVYRPFLLPGTANPVQSSGDFCHGLCGCPWSGASLQNLMGTSAKVQNLRSRLSEEEYNQYSVRLELQADFYAGVWANHAQQIGNSRWKVSLKQKISMKH